MTYRLATGRVDVLAVESLDDEHLLLAHRITERRNLGWRDRKSERGQETQAQPFVLDRVAQVRAHVADEAKRQLQ